MCENLDFIRIIYFLKNILDIIYIIVPILLILMLAIDISKIILASDIEGVRKKSMSMIVKRTLAVIAIFFLPAFLFYLIGLTGVSGANDGVLCWNKASIDTIEHLQAARDLEEELKKQEKEAKREEVSSNTAYVSGIPTSNNYQPFINGVQRSLQKGECMKKEDNCFCPTVGKNTGFQFTVESATGRNFNWTSRNDKMVQVVVKCSDGSVIKRTVNSNAKENFEKAFNKVCQIKTTGINGVKLDASKIVLDGTLVERLNSARTICSPHAYGYAIDINYAESVEVFGVVHKPWAGQGARTKTNYDAFVRAIGSESDIRNVNYILWKYAFEPAGFNWGGNWGATSFDPMHFEAT